MSDTQVVDWAIGELGNVTVDQPFFMAVGIYRPHVPWYVPSEYFDRFPLEGVTLPETREDDLADLPEAATKHIKRDWHQWILKKDQWKGAVQAYLASMAYADDQVGRLVDALNKSVHGRNTVVILCSDHGYHLGEKQHWEKFVLWDEATRVPLIVAGPGIEGGRRIPVPVSLLDLYPTLTSLTGLNAPGHLEGDSLVPWMRDGDAPGERWVLTTQRKGCHAVLGSRYRYILYQDGSDELYDHRNDPNEWDNLADDKNHAPVVERMRSHLPGQ